MGGSRKRKLLLVLALALVSLFARNAVAGIIAGGSAWGKPGEDYVPGEIVVKFKAGIATQQAVRTSERYGTSILSTSPYSKVRRLAVPEGMTVPQMVEILSQDPNVEYTHPNYICYAAWEPNDGWRYELQWHFDNNHIRMPDAWDISPRGGSSSIVVAVLDTGVAYRTGDGFTQAPDLVNTAFVAGYDYCNGTDCADPDDAYPDDEKGHGTHVCGTIAQSTNNGPGVAGMAFNCSIMPVKVLNAAGSGTSVSVKNGIYYARIHGADVINLSLTFDTDPGAAVHDAIKAAHDDGIVICAATGNDNVGNIYWPAAYSECIAVGATQWDDTRAPYSNYGTGIDIVAPGGNINLDQNGDGYADGVLQQTYEDFCDGITLVDYSSFVYCFMQGTSMSTPHVSGLAALILSRNSGLTEAQVRSYICDYAEDLGDTGCDTTFGYGRIDAAASLGAVPAGGGGTETIEEGGGGGCFIATVAFSGSRIQDPGSQLDILRRFRDEYLLTNTPGRAFVRFYYRHSPPIAEFISERESFRAVIRLFLRPIIWGARRIMGGE